MIENVTSSTSFQHNPTGEKIYVLTQTVSADLQNGFLYVAELLLQHHSCLMYRAMNTLDEHNIKVFTIKTDALTIQSEDLSQSKEVLHFSPGLGKWRHAKTGQDIIFPTKPLEKRINNLTTLPSVTVNQNS